MPEFTARVEDVSISCGRTERVYTDISDGSVVSTHVMVSAAIET